MKVDREHYERGQEDGYRLAQWLERHQPRLALTAWVIAGGIALVMVL